MNVADEPAVLAIRGLAVTYPDGSRGLRGVDLEVRRGSCVAIVGESGCGKSTLLGAVLGVLPRRTRVVGSVRVGAAEQVGASGRSTRRVRQTQLGYVPQNPFAAVDPLRSVVHHVRFAARAARCPIDAREAAARLVALGIDPTAVSARRWPHQWSGGMLQRACIAAATVAEPSVVLADEPTSALDPDAATAVLSALRTQAAALVLVTHDLAVARSVADDVAVLYAGRIVEYGSTASVLGAPRHPYTAALVAATPQAPGRAPRPLPGEPPDPRSDPPGCLFRARCTRAHDACGNPPPPGRVACHRPHSAAT